MEHENHINNELESCPRLPTLLQKSSEILSEMKATIETHLFTISTLNLAITLKKAKFATPKRMPMAYEKARSAESASTAATLRVGSPQAQRICESVELSRAKTVFGEKRIRKMLGYLDILEASLTASEA